MNVKCPKCKQLLKVSDASRDQIVKCPCGQRLTVKAQKKVTRKQATKADALAYAVKKTMLGKSVVKFACPQCETKLSDDLTDAGNGDQCPQCGTQFVTPGVKEKQELDKGKKKEQLKKKQQKEQAAESPMPSTETPSNPNLMACGDCNGSMSKRAKACPHCGAPNAEASQKAIPPLQDTSFGNLDLPPVNTIQAVVTAQPRFLQASTQQQTSTSKPQEDETANREEKGRLLPLVVVGSFLGALLLLGLLAFGLNALLFNPVAIKQRQVDRIFSGPNGSSPVIVRDIKEFLLDPKSFEHVSTEYGHQNRDDFDDGALIVRVKFRAKSKLGASVLGEKYYVLSYNNEIVGDGPVGPRNVSTTLRQLSQRISE